MLEDRLHFLELTTPSLCDNNMQRHNIFSYTDLANPNGDHKLKQALAQPPPPDRKWIETPLG
jgi:hypothetical protein